MYYFFGLSFTLTSVFITYSPRCLLDQGCKTICNPKSISPGFCLHSCNSFTPIKKIMTCFSIRPPLASTIQKVIMLSSLSYSISPAEYIIQSPFPFFTLWVYCVNLCSIHPTWLVSKPLHFFQDLFWLSHPAGPAGHPEKCLLPSPVTSIAGMAPPEQLPTSLSSLRGLAGSSLGVIRTSMTWGDSAAGILFFPCPHSS